MLAVIGIAAVKVTSCPANGTYLRTEGCNDIYADGICGEYSVDNGSCDPCEGCDPYGTFLRAEGCYNILADGCCGEYSEPNLCCNCDPEGTYIDEVSTPWAGSVDADGTDWNIYSIEFTFADGCCGTYNEMHWYALSDTLPFELTSPDDGVSPNPPNGYVLIASAIYSLMPDGNTYATYSEDPMWLTPTFTTEEHDKPWLSCDLVADGSGGSYNNQTVQPADTVMSNPFIWTFNGKHVRYYSTGTTFDDGTNGSHPSFDIISCPDNGTYIETLVTGGDWNIEITLESLGTPYSLRVGTMDVISVNDGACGVESIGDNYTPEPVDTLLYDETISSYYYYSDGEGGYYSVFYG